MNTYPESLRVTGFSGGNVDLAEETLRGGFSGVNRADYAALGPLQRADSVSAPTVPCHRSKGMANSL